MRIIKYSLGQLQANCYFLMEENNCLIIDPADDAAFILEILQSNKLNLVAMLATHGHFDHMMGVGEMQLSFAAPLYIFKEDIFLLHRTNETAKYFLGYNPGSIAPKYIEFLKAGKFKIKNFEFKIVSTPGHTPGSCCYYFADDKVVFTGDTLFKNGIGRCDFSYSSKEDLKKSLKNILKLPKNTIIYAGHGESSTIKSELTNIKHLI